MPLKALFLVAVSKAERIVQVKITGRCIGEFRLRHSTEEEEETVRHEREKEIKDHSG